ncbi:MAG: DUF1501 domain-containing protein [Prosthecobacter sp.]|nr:DUF1501 domain-containing protein [Prosthecobacter sp.]
MHQISTLFSDPNSVGGTIYGASDKEGDAPAGKQTTIQDTHSTIGHATGMDVNQVVMSPINRPFTVGNKGSVIIDILS